jgi:hypothetical protein
MLELIRSDFPDTFVADCAHPGPCDADVAYWLGEIGLALDPEDAAAYLKGYGAWDAEKDRTDHRANLMRILWLAAGDFNENVDGDEDPAAYFDRS